ncbi:MAG: T9SS type A sorting domain-containing protein [Fibromonadaceae bacterium]|jgi:hypothetical protein|nr:T9SS type A sorting domain-containing protein [Fibromonadaceae bacterium]
MNTFKKAGLAIAVASSMAFAQGNLWGTDDEKFMSLQVLFDGVRECWAGSPPDEMGQSPCYESTGGWWFGYAENGGSTLQAHIGNEWVNFGAAPSPRLTDAMGLSLIGSGFSLKYYAGPAEAEDKPGLAAIGVNVLQNPNTGGENVAAKGGVCVVYRSNEDINLELGWHEATYGYNTFQALLPASAAGRMINLTWDATATGRTSGDFSRETWAPLHDIAVALNDLRALKFPLKNTTTTPIAADFTLCELGWAGSCSSTYTCSGSTPIIGGGAVAVNAVNLKIAGRMLSLAVERSTAVQIINLQGAVVYSQTLTPAKQLMNLSNLPTGVYMVRVPDLGYANKILLK